MGTKTLPERSKSVYFYILILKLLIVEAKNKASVNGDRWG